MAGSLPIFLLTFASIRVSPEIMMSWLAQNLSQYLAAGVVIATINESHNHLRVAPPNNISQSGVNSTAKIRKQSIFVSKLHAPVRHTHAGSI